MIPFQDSSDVLFVAGFEPIVTDYKKSHSFYLELLKLPLKPIEEGSQYLTCEQDGLEGVKHFALWPIKQAAQSCFSQNEWPENILTPQSWMEFVVSDIEKITDICLKEGYVLLVYNRMEPWGQTVTRLLSPEGMLIGLTVTPWLRE